MNEASAVALATRTYGDSVNFVTVVLGHESDGAGDVLDGFGLSDAANVIDEDQQVWSQFGISSHPAIVLLEADGTWDRTTGQIGPWKLQDGIDAMLERAGALQS